MLNALMTQPKATNIDGIKTLHDVTINRLKSLQNMDIDVDNWDPILVYIIHERLPTSSQNLWKQIRFSNKEIPNWEDMKSFLQSCFISAELEHTKPSSQASSSSSHQNQKPAFKRTQTLHSTNSSTCKMNGCEEKHHIRSCPSFIKLGIAERIDKARQLNLCLNCLGTSHKSAQCNSEYRCSTCSKKHHSLLYIPTDTKQNGPPKTNALNSTSKITKSCQILLTTAIINAQSTNGIIHQLRALIDSGSQSSFITENAVQKLNLKKTANRVQVYGLGRVDAGISPGIVRLTIGSIHDPLFAIQMDALVMPKLTNLMPSENIDISYWKHLTGIQLADPKFFEPGNIDIIIGANLYASIILQGVKVGVRGTPLAQETVFGWILTGPTTSINNFRTEVTNLHQQIDIDQQLRRFFEDEDVPVERQWTEDEKSCEEQFRKSYYRDSSGRYVVSLPFKTNIGLPLLGDSYGAAYNRLRGLERRLLNDRNFAIEYTKCLQEYLDLDHMELVNQKDTVDSVNYLAHH